jgi:hypothetical protein
MPCSSQQLNNRLCRQNAACPVVTSSRPCDGRGGVVAVGKLLKFYIELNCLDHERIAPGLQVRLVRSNRSESAENTGAPFALSVP